MRISDWSSDVCSSDLFSQELQVNGSLGPLSLTAGTYYYDEDIDYTLTADILPGMYGFLVNAGICPSAAAPCFAATRGFRQPSPLSIKAYAGFGQGTFRFPDWLTATGEVGKAPGREKRETD